MLRKESSSQFKQVNHISYSWDSNLLHFIVSQTYHFDDFVSWCDINYSMDKITIMSTNGLVVVCQINPESISKVLRVSINPTNRPFNEETLLTKFCSLSLTDIVKLFDKLS